MTASADRGTAAASQRLEATVRGLVQGVGFRWWVVHLAADLDLGGWVANRGDGAVAVVAEGSPTALDRLESALRGGPPGAMVDHVDIRRGPASGAFTRFEIRSGAHSGD